MRRMPALAAIAAGGIIMLAACAQGTPPPAGDPSESPTAAPSESAASPVANWPRSVPVPPGAALDDTAAGQYTVSAERADFDAYAELVAGLRDSEEVLSTEQNAFRRTFAIDGFIVQIEFDEAAGTMTVTAD